MEIKDIPDLPEAGPLGEGDLFPLTQGTVIAKKGTLGDVKDLFGIPSIEDDVAAVQAALDDKEDVANKGVASGYAGLDGDGKVPEAQLPSLYVSPTLYKGPWDADTNTPSLASGVGTTGWLYIVSVAGTTTLDGISSWSEGDQAIFDGAAWTKVPNDGKVNVSDKATGSTPDDDDTKWVSKKIVDETKNDLLPSLEALAAPRRIKNKLTDRWSIRDFGNHLCGLSDNPSATDEAESFRKALNSGERIYLPPGRYPLRSNDPATDGMGTGVASVYVEGVPVDVEFAGDARIIVGAEVEGSRGFLMFKADPDPDPTNVFSICRLKNLSIDGSAVSATTSGLRMVDILGYNRVEVLQPRLVSPVGTPSSSAPGFGGADTGLGITRCSHITIDGGWYAGFGDAAIYISGNPGEDRDGSDGIGEQYSQIGGFFYRCLNGITCKRDFYSSSIIGPTMKECVNGISAGSTNEGPNDFGRGWTIMGARLFKMQGRPIYLQSGFGHVLKGNHIWDYGLWISDQSQLTAATIGGMTLSGIRESIVSGNSIGFKEWALPGGAATSDGPHGIVLNDNTEADPDEGATDNLITDNLFKKVYFAIRESGAANRNIAWSNKEIDVVAGNNKTGGDSYFRTIASEVADAEASGTFVPTLKGSVGDASAYDLRHGRYWKRGKLVNFEVYIDLNATTGLDGTVTVDISGIGFVPASSPANIPIELGIHNSDITHSSASYTEFKATLPGNSSAVSLVEVGSGAMAALTHARFGANSRLSLSGSFITA